MGRKQKKADPIAISRGSPQQEKHHDADRLRNPLQRPDHAVVQGEDEDELGVSEREHGMPRAKPRVRSCRV
jgi:hypothetical protein